MGMLTVPVEPATGRQSFDPWLLMMTAVLLVFGLLLMTSASIEIASRQFGDPFFHFKRQLLFLLVSLAAGIVVLRMPMRYWYKGSVAWLVLAWLLLILVLVPGLSREVNGSARWFRFGLQASEPAKFLLLVFMAWFLGRNRELIRTSIKGFILPLIFLAFPVALLLVEPDFGAAVVLTIAVLGMMFLAGVKIWQFLLAGIGLAGLGTSLILTSSYRMRRLETFLQALKDPFHEDFVYDSGYQLAQALIAFGRGEWFGVGLGNSIQKMYFLPEAHTDFILSIIAEELGVVGVLLLLLLFFLFASRVLLIARRNEQSGRFFAAYLAYGIAFLFLGQVLINVAVNTGLLPTKGLTLPFMSYGRSSLIVNVIMVAVLLRIDYEHQLLQLPRAGGRV